MKETKYIRLIYCILQFILAYCSHLCILFLIVFNHWNINLHWIFDVVIIWLFVEFCTGQYYLSYKDKDKYYENMKKKAYNNMSITTDKSTVSDLHEPSKPF